jgi:hypothetical protein
MSFRLIEAAKAEHSVSRLCSVLGVSRAGYHAWRRRPPSARARADAALSSAIVAAFEGSRRTYGAPRIHAVLAPPGDPGRQKARRPPDGRARHRGRQPASRPGAHHGPRP